MSIATPGVWPVRPGSYHHFTSAIFSCSLPEFAPEDTSSRSIPCEGRVAFLEECGDALLVVLRVAAEGLAHGLQGGGEVTLEAFMQGLLDPAQSPRRQPGETPREFRNRFFELLVGDDL